MIEWATSGDEPRLGGLLRPTVSERECAYDRDSHMGRLAHGLDEAEGRGWRVVDLAADWSRVFP